MWSEVRTIFEKLIWELDVVVIIRGVRGRCELECAQATLFVS